jgi:hypothetical protein
MAPDRRAAAGRRLRRAFGLGHEFAGQGLDDGVVEGGKGRLATAAELVFQAELPCRPALPPAADGVGVQSDAGAGGAVGQGWLLVQEQGEPRVAGVGPGRGATREQGARRFP